MRWLIIVVGSLAALVLIVLAAYEARGSDSHRPDMRCIHGVPCGTVAHAPAATAKIAGIKTRLRFMGSLYQ